LEPKPTPGTGTLFINTMRDGTWSGSWQDEGFSDILGSEAEVKEWANRQPAARKLIFDRKQDSFVAYETEQ
jgi:hypothetical protein